MPQERAEAALAALWDSVDWSDPGSWDGDDANGQSVLWAGSRITSPEHVKERLSQALTRRPDVVLPLVAACAGWEESRDHEDWRVLGFRRRYRELPAWFPAQAVVAAAASAAPNAASVAVNAFGETDGDDADSLLAQFLWPPAPGAPSALSAGVVAGRSVAGWRDQAQDEVDALACRTTCCSGGGSGGRARLSAPNYVTPFAVAAVAGAALDAGTEHRTALADRAVVARLCGAFSELDDPDLAGGPDGSLRGLLSRLAYQQLGFGGSFYDEAARSIGLLLDHAAHFTSGPSPEECERLLGVPLETLHAGRVRRVRGRRAEPGSGDSGAAAPRRRRAYLRPGPAGRRDCRRGPVARVDATRAPRVGS